jgi:hypothetical protein
MASQKKQRANQLNAKASTGPKTQQGKAIAKTNATRHGILSQELMLPHENPEEFGALLQSLIAELGARGTLECTLVERIAVAIWRQRRLVRAERQDIEQQNEPDSPFDQFKNSSGREPSLNSVPDEQLIDMTLSSYRFEGKLDDLEKELRQMANVKAITDDVYEADFPLLANLFPVNKQLASNPFEKNGAEKMNVLPAGERNKWLAGILRVRARSARLDTDREAANAITIPSNTESLARYQAALDNEWYKAMRAFREARQHRLNTLENVQNQG